MLSVKHALKDIIETVAETGSCRGFSSALRAAGLVETLRRSGPFTVFVPNDEAFAKLGEATLQEWLRPEGRAKLKGILTYHVVSGRLLASDLVKSSSVKTVQGTGLTIHFQNNRMHVNNAMALRTDIACGNGVIHLLDTVVIPR